MAIRINVHNVEFSRVEYFKSENFVEFGTSSTLNEEQLKDALKVVVRLFPHSDFWIISCKDSDGDDLIMILYADECGKFPYSCSGMKVVNKERVWRTEFVEEFEEIRKEFYYDED